MKDGILRVTNIGATCFLGFGAGKHRGPSTLKVRIKAKAGGSHVDWIPGGVGAATQRADFRLQADEAWQEVSVALPATGPLGIVRLYLPMQEAVEIDWIALNEEKTDF